MKRQMTKIVSTMMVTIFVLSILPFVSTTDSTSELRNAINMVQLLQQPEKSPQSAFKTIFKNTIISLQAAADLQTIFTHQQQTEQQDKAQVTVSIRLPYLMAKPTEIPAPISEAHITVIDPPNLYNSHIISPSSPPPLCS